MDKYVGKSQTIELDYSTIYIYNNGNSFSSLNTKRVPVDSVRKIKLSGNCIHFDLGPWENSLSIEMKSYNDASSVFHRLDKLCYKSPLRFDGDYVYITESSNFSPSTAKILIHQITSVRTTGSPLAGFDRLLVYYGDNKNVEIRLSSPATAKAAEQELNAKLKKDAAILRLRRENEKRKSANINNRSVHNSESTHSPEQAAAPKKRFGGIIRIICILLLLSLISSVSNRCDSNSDPDSGQSKNELIVDTLPSDEQDSPLESPPGMETVIVCEPIDADMVSFIGIPTDEIITTWGENYQVSAWGGSNYIWYDDCPYGFYYSSSEDDMDFKPDNTDKIIGIEVFGQSVRVVGTVYTGSPLSDVEAYLQKELTLEKSFDYDNCLESLVEIDGLTFRLIFDENSKTLLSAFCHVNL